MNVQQGDPIDQLPSDKLQPNPNELQIIDTLFKNNRRSIDIILTELKDAVIVGVIVVLLSLPQFQQLINRLIPITNTSPYILILIKALFAILLFWVLKFFSLARK